MDLKKIIRDIPDFPIKGILFHDVTPLFKDPQAMSYLIAELKKEYQASKANTICAMDARGFILGAALAYEVKAPLVLVRKKGKLPGAKVSTKYSLEYGTAEIEMQDDIDASSKVILVDDLVATGGTLLAATKLIRELNGELVSIACVVDMPDLGGSAKLKEVSARFFKMVEYLGH